MFNCSSCKFSNILVKEGEIYSYLNPVGDVVVRTHDTQVLECRALPPIAGSWPQVSEEDWCGYGESNGHS